MTVFTGDSGIRNVRSLLCSGFKYSVPKFQRGFSWGKDQIEQFWEDLKYVIESEEEQYFFGSMVFYPKTSKEYVIVDGQQRIAILNIFYAVIRDIFLDLGFLEESSGVYHDYLGRVQRRSGKHRGNLELSKDDNDFFNKYILDRKKGYKQKDLKYSNKLIRNAYDFLYTEINNVIAKIPKKDDKKEYLCLLEETVRDKFVFMSTIVHDQSKAYIVFETLNDRGLDLSINDLLKNHLFFNAEIEGNLSSVEKTWKEIVNILENKPRIINLFLRHFWMSSKGMVRQKELFRALKRGVAQKGSVIKFINELKEEAEVYSYLMSPEKQYWNDDEIVRLLDIINILKVKQCLPLLLSGRLLKPKEFKELIKICINFTFRYSTVCNQSTNVLEKIYTPIAIDIRNKLTKKESVSISNIKDKLKHIFPDDDIFIKKFSNLELKDKRIIRYTLSMLNDSMGTGEMVCNKDPSVVNIEHILPKKPDSEWEKFLKKKKMDYSEWVNKVGNLTLLLSEFNREASNKFFDKKKKDIYSKSQLPITKPLCSIKEWTDKEIIKRQNKFGKMAVEIWKLE